MTPHHPLTDLPPLTQARARRPSRATIVLAAAFMAFALATLFGVAAAAQTTAAVRSDVRPARGSTVSPVYEGWYEIEGTKYALFSYYNRNLEEVVEVPVGPQNQLSPGAPDQRQPTRFVPGMSYGVFAVALPKDQPKPELTWTLTANGQTTTIPVTLDSLYLVSPHRETGSGNPGNTPPLVRFDPSGPSVQGPHGMVVTRTATVGRPLELDVWVTDDGPPRRPDTRVPASLTSQYLGVWGLAVRWHLYRGSGAVKFSNAAPEVEQGKARTTVTFSAPGEYMLYLLAVDSRTPTRCCWTNAYVKVKVDGAAQPR